jgi:hypothetical protein
MAIWVQKMRFSEAAAVEMTPERQTPPPRGEE